jgi:hypothetical protein
MGRSGDNVTVSAGGKAANDDLILREGVTYLMESFNELEFTAPDRYFQRIISYNSTFPEQGNEISPIDYIQASFYQPVLAEIAISPLSPKAFSYYNFRFIGTSLQGNNIINKIEVIPKYKSQQLFAGTIFIIEDLWCLHSVDLTNENLAGEIRIRELYIPVQDDIWLPVSHQFDIDLQIIGIKADIGYTSSVKYLEVRPNEKLQKPVDLLYGSLPPYQSDTIKASNNEEISRILRKEELKNRDMTKLGKLLEKESKNSREEDRGKSLEIKDNTTRVVEKDAGSKDSSYWAEIRPIPLSETELRNIEISDSIKSEIPGTGKTDSDTVPTSNGRKKSGKTGRKINYLFTGNTWSDKTGLSITSGGILDLKNLSFNTVDGFVHGLDFRINKRIDNLRSLSFYPDLRYAFSRGKLMWRINASYSTGGLKPGHLYMRAGITSKDIGSDGGINPVINSLTSLLTERNFLKLYESSNYALGYEKEISNGLKLKIEGAYENREILENTTSFSIINTGREYTDNIPVSRYLETEDDINNYLSDQKHIRFITSITFTPNQSYRIDGGNKVSYDSEWPTLAFTWEHGATSIYTSTGNYRHFDKFSFEISHIMESGAFSELRWKIRTGGFADNRHLSFFDFFHFNSQPFTLIIDNYNNAFMLPAYYSLSTSEFYGEGHLKYTTPYLLLKRIPGFSNTLIRENLIFSYLGSWSQINYTEIGYSLSEIFFLGEAGIFAGFHDFKYSNLGFRITLRFH